MTLTIGERRPVVPIFRVLPAEFVFLLARIAAVELPVRALPKNGVAQPAWRVPGQTGPHGVMSAMLFSKQEIGCPHSAWSMSRMIMARKLGSLLALAVASICVAQGASEDGAVPQNSEGQLETSSDSETLRKALELLDSGESEQQAKDDGVQDLEDDESGEGDESIFAGRETSFVGGRLSLPPIVASTTQTSGIGNGRLPVGYRGGMDSPTVSLPETGEQRGLPWQWQTGTWAATNSFSHPLYFEDRQLERHGHQRYPALQPLISGGRFVAQWAALPYLSTLHPPCDCEYTLGHYRSGSCAPVLRQRAPWSRKAAAAQATSIVGGFWALP